MNLFLNTFNYCSFYWVVIECTNEKIYIVWISYLLPFLGILSVCPYILDYEAISKKVCKRKSKKVDKNDNTIVLGGHCLNTFLYHTQTCSYFLLNFFEFCFTKVLLVTVFVHFKNLIWIFWYITPILPHILGKLSKLKIMERKILQPNQLFKKISRMSRAQMHLGKERHSLVTNIPPAAC